MRRFVFVDAAQSTAGRQNFGESIGLITAAFYVEQGRALGVGRTLGGTPQPGNDGTSAPAACKESSRSATWMNASWTSSSRRRRRGWGLSGYYLVRATPAGLPGR